METMLSRLAEIYCEYLRANNYSEKTIEMRKTGLSYFFIWCNARELAEPEQINRQIFDRYAMNWKIYRTKEGKPLSFRSIRIKLFAVKMYFKWLASRRYIEYNPLSDVEMPRLERKMPHSTLSAEEIERVMNIPDTTARLGIRDRAILETFYATGMRRMEIKNLKMKDIDAEKGTVFISQGKGKKDRLIPIGKRALFWIGKYCEEVRADFAVVPDEGILFIYEYGKEYALNFYTKLVKKYLRAAGIDKEGSCHIFRHTMATHMHENGADIRFIQQMLGHESITATQIYTQVNIVKLKEVYTLTHPMEKEESGGAQGHLNCNPVLPDKQ